MPATETLDAADNAPFVPATEASDSDDNAPLMPVKVASEADEVDSDDLPIAAPGDATLDSRSESPKGMV